MTRSDSVGGPRLSRTLWVVAALVVFGALAGDPLLGTGLPCVNLVVTMICLTLLRLFGAGPLMPCTVPVATASTLMPPRRSHRQEEEQ
jgi:hypothetical protein